MKSSQIGANIAGVLHCGVKWKSSCLPRALHLSLAPLHPKGKDKGAVCMMVGLSNFCECSNGAHWLDVAQMNNGHHRGASPGRGSHPHSCTAVSIVSQKCSTNGTDRSGQCCKPAQVRHGWRCLKNCKTFNVLGMFHNVAKRLNLSQNVSLCLTMS